MNTNDLSRALSRLEDLVTAAHATELREVTDWIDELAEKFEEVGNEAGYLISEHEDNEAELEEYQSVWDDSDAARRAWDIIDNFGGFEEAEEAAEQMAGSSDLVEENEQLKDRVRFLEEQLNHQDAMILGAREALDAVPRTALEASEMSVTAYRASYTEQEDTIERMMKQLAGE